MYNWDRTVLPRINMAADKDSAFIQIIQSRDEAESVFEKIMDKLSATDRAWIENYITHCEDLEYRKAQIAYQIGVRDGESGRQCIQTGWLL